MWRNLWITLLISGLWHGAATTFLVWGAVHALLLTVEKLSRPVWRSWPAGLRRLGVWVGVLTAWVFFRADSMGQAMEVLRNLYTWSAVDLQPMAFFDSYFYLGLAILFEGLYGLSLQWGRLGSLLRHPVVTSLETGVLVACCLFLRGPEQAFIYFQF
jgi:D-alanyl-lipoteichoic acid acyltransferase DltB (MBOAT superfamily)